MGLGPIAHGCGFPKELYEPLWEDLLSRSRQDGYRIRSIWIADVANLGASGLANEKFLGNDPSWFDHSRDLLYMINKFRDQMPQPISDFFFNALLSLLHPRLFTSLSLVELVITPDIFTGKGPLLTVISLKRRDTWKSRAAAIENAKITHKGWDKRVLDRWILHAYRDLPSTTTTQKNLTAQVEQPVTLTSSKYQEVLQYLRPNPSRHRSVGEEPTSNTPPHDDLLYPDIIGPPETTTQFYRYEPILAWKMLKHLRPPVLYVMGQNSPIAAPETREKILKRTGAGIGGSGGAKALRVKEKVIPGSHQLPLEKVLETAAAVGPWISSSVRRWKEDQARIAEGWACQPISDRLKNMADWVPKLEKMMAPERRESRL